MTNQPAYCDSHVHFDLLVEAGSVPDVLARAKDAGVTRMLAAGNDAGGNALALRLAAEYPDVIRAAAGFGRDSATAAVDLAGLEAQIRAVPPGRVVAVGEIGLDLHYSPETAEAQTRLFAQQLELARRLELPVIVHSRAAEAATLDHLAAHAQAWRGAGDRIGVLHCFTGDTAFARRLLDLGLHISFSGIVTFRTADALREVARFVPQDRLLIETDSPYLAPVPHRGQPNEPAFLPAVAERLAQVRGCAVEQIAACTSANATKLFAW